MKTTSKAVAMLLATSIAAAAPLVSLAQAESGHTAPITTEQAAKPVMLKASAGALSAMNEIRNARLALFEGDTDSARTFVKTALEGVQGDMGSYLIKDSGQKAEDSYLLPFDSSIGVSEHFVLADHHSPALQAAGSHMNNGDKDSAIQVLVEADIDVTTQAAMLPAAETVDNLKAAVNDLDSGKFYEANLVLQSIEKSVAVKTFAASELPQQGYDANEVL